MKTSGKVHELVIAPAAGPGGKRPKREEKLHRARGQTMDPREQCRNLWEAVNQARRLVELADHKARYALVVMGVVNAAVFLLATRSDHFAQLVPASLRPGFSLLIFPFGFLAILFLVDAYNSLRPRPPALPPGISQPGGDGQPRGLIFWDRLLAGSVEHYQRAWQEVRRDQFNNELAAMAYSLARGIQRKYAALHRLYIELLLIILLAGIILAIPMFYGFLSNGLQVLPVP